MDIEPDDKDWTWVLEQRCPECGLTAADVPVASIGARVRSQLPRWTAALQRDDACERSTPATWSTTEYACHVRDVHKLFAERLSLMLAEDDPEFANWDQDATAVDDDYASQDPTVVSDQLVAVGEAMADALDGLTPDVLARTGRRSNGSVFTIETFAQYYLHDVEHHLSDVER